MAPEAPILGRLAVLIRTAVRVPALLSCAGMLVLTGCHTPSRVELRETPAWVLKQLDSRSRAPRGDETAEQALHLTVTVAAERPVTVPLVWKNGVPCVNARLNGRRPAPFLVDTGAEQNALQARTAAAGKVTILKHPSLFIAAAGVSGNEDVLLGVADKFEFGDATLHNNVFFVRTHETQVVSLGWKRRTFGVDILGMGVIANTCHFLTFDYPAQQIVFGFQESFRPGPGRKIWRVPMELRAGRPFITLRSGNVSWKAMVDTGYAGTMDIRRSTAKRLNLLDHVRPNAGFWFGLGDPSGGASSYYDVVAVPDIRGFGSPLASVDACLVGETDHPMIGTGVLQQYRVTFDFQREVLWLEK
jgi:hypothetical protein